MKFKRALGISLIGIIMATNTVFAGSKTVNIGGKSANIVEINMDGNKTGEIAIAGNKIHTTSNSDSLINTVKTGNETVISGINGGFFNSYYDTGKAISFPSNSPSVYATVVKNGELINGVGTSNMIGFTWDGEPIIDRVTLKVKATINDTDKAGIWSVNKYSNDKRAIDLFTDEFNHTVVVPVGSTVFSIVDGVVKSVAGSGSYKPIANTSFLIYNSEVIENVSEWGMLPEVGDKITFNTYAEMPVRKADLNKWNNIKSATSGGRMLVQNGYNVVNDKTYNETFTDPKQSATFRSNRAFIGISKDGKIVLGTAVASMSDIAKYLVANNIRDAISLDGGASTMLYDNGKFITPAGRNLATAIVIVDEKTKEMNKNANKPVKETIPTNNKTTSGEPISNEPSPWAVSVIEKSKTLKLVPEWLQYKYNVSITRQEFAVLIKTLLEQHTGKTISELRAEKAGELKIFTDTDDWYVKEVGTIGIISGYEDGSFKPNDSLTREQASIILQKTAEIIGDTSLGELKTFNDSASISSWAKNGVDFVTSRKIMNGDGKNFNPKGTITREQAYITMVNAFENFNK